MSYVDLYGRNPRTDRTTFEYPQPVMPGASRPPLYVGVPSRIIGEPGSPMMELADTSVQLDPTSSYSYTQRGFGLGGLGADPAPGSFREFRSDVFRMAESNPTLMYVVVGVVGLLGLMGLKVLGRMAS